MKRKGVFKKFTIIYFSILTILCGLFIYYVVDSLILYENSNIEKHIANLVVEIASDAKRNKIDKYIDVNRIKVSNLEDTNTSVKQAYAKIFKSKKISYKLVEGTIKDNPTYDILADDEVLFTIKLKSAGQIHRMGLLSFPDWQIDEINYNTDRGVYYYDLYVLDSYKVLVNDKELNIKEGEKKELDSELKELSKFTQLPNIIYYQLDNLTTEPDIEVYDGNKKMDIKENKRVIEAYELFMTDNIKDLNNKLVADTDVLETGKLWSKFLTDDLAGTYHGYSTIKNYLVEDTHLWNMAYEWSHGVDITFVSNHTLVGFENEKISNCIVYNNKAFSCDVYLEKNMRLRSGKARKDIMNDKLYFVYYNDAWKLVSMKAITDESIEEN